MCQWNICFQKSFYLDGISLVEQTKSSVFAHFSPCLSFSVSMCVRQVSSPISHNHNYLRDGRDDVKVMDNVAFVYCMCI